MKLKAVVKFMNVISVPKFRPGTGRWQAQPDGGVGFGWGKTLKVRRARRATPASVDLWSTSSRATSPFRGGISEAAVLHAA
jgi:hypothetical protein